MNKSDAFTRQKNNSRMEIGQRSYRGEDIKNRIQGTILKIEIRQKRMLRNQNKEVIINQLDKHGEWVTGCGKESLIKK